MNNSYNVCNPNFTSVYVVKTSPEEFVSFLQKFPKFCKKHTVFRAESPNHAAVYNELRKVAEREQIDFSDVLKSAESHGIITTQQIQDLPMIVVTGFEKFKLWCLNLTNFTGTLKNALSDTRNALTQGLPKDLVGASALKSLADKKMPQFEDFLKANNTQYLSFDEFFHKLIRREKI